MDKKLEPIIQALQENFSVTFEEFRGETHVFLEAETIIAALTLLRDKYDFELLSALSAIDFLPQTSPRYHVIYQLTSLARNLALQLRVPLADGEPHIPTATGVYEYWWPVGTRDVHGGGIVEGLSNVMAFHRSVATDGAQVLYTAFDTHIAESYWWQPGSGVTTTLLE